MLTKGRESLDGLERYIMAMIEKDVDIAKEYALEDIVMNEYIEEAETTSFNNGFGESYDHELADRKQSYNDGYDDGIEKGIKQGIEQGIEQGLEKGIKQGIKQGEKNGIIKTAIFMLKDNLDINTVAKYTGLSIDELKELNKNN